jgi:broad specificity phosphatase PhoE
MSMPNNLVLVRHGRSEGNVATEAAKKGDLQYYERDNGRFMTVPGHQWRLTPLGQQQASVIGAWIQNEFATFDRYYVSPFVRTRETAGMLQLPGAQWLMNRALRERDWGDVGSIPWTDFQSRDIYKDNAFQNSIDPLYWCPTGGESIAHVAENRVRNVLDTLHRECQGQNVIAVTHGEMLWSFRLVLERWNDEEFVAHDADKSEKIHNCEVLHYTRVDPDSPTGEVSPRLNWLRRARPIQDADGSWRIAVSPWLKLSTPLKSNEELLASIDEVPHLF